MDFNNAYRFYMQLKEQYEQGQINVDEYERSVNDLAITDSAGNQWQIGVRTGKWYRFDGQNWVEDIPAGMKPTAASIAPSVISSPAPEAPSRFPWAAIGCGAAILVMIGMLVAGGLLYFYGDTIFYSGTEIAPTVIMPQPPASITQVSPATPETNMTAPPGYSQPGALLFQDDFSNPNSGWDDIRVRDDFNTYYFEDAYLFLILSAATLAEAHPNLNFSGDVLVEVDARQTSGSNFDEYGLLCRYVENGDGTRNYYYFAISTDGLGVIYKVDHNDKSLVITDPPGNRSDIIRAGDQVNRIRASCVGGTLTLYVNGQPLVSAVDSSFTGGGVGLRADSESGETEIRFDNFVVYEAGR